jgi:hypothetical protein
MDGTWSITSDHLEKVADYEARRVRDRPVVVEKLSPVPLQQLAKAEAATWLDRELAAASPLPVRDAGFGSELRSALAARTQWLIEEQLAEAENGKVRLRPDALALLQRRELLAVSQELANELGKPFIHTESGGMVAGTLIRRIDLVSGRFALIEQSKEFTLVPWRPVLEKQIGKTVSGFMRSDGISWRFERSRTGPVIS